MSCNTCGCSEASKSVQYRCDCGEECGCGIIEFDKEPNAVPYCCGIPMKRIK